MLVAVLMMSMQMVKRAGKWVQHIENLKLSGDTQLGAKISRTGVCNLGHQRKNDQDEERNQHTESKNFVVWLVHQACKYACCSLAKYPIFIDFLVVALGC